MEKAKELVKQILTSKTADVKDLIALKDELFADGIISEKEAQFVREMNSDILRKCETEEAYEVWKKTFVEIMTSFVLEDEKSKGVIDEKETAWLVKVIKADARIVDIEKELLKNLKAKAPVFPEALNALL